MLNLYIVGKRASIYQRGYIEYILVAADNADTARRILPYCVRNRNNLATYISIWWDTPENLTVQLIGTAAPDIEPGILAESWMS